MDQLHIPKITNFDYKKSESWKEISKQRIAHANWKEFPYSPEVSFKITHDGQVLYIHYDVVEQFPVRAVNTKDQAPVYEDSCVEFFILAQDGKYHNFEFNSKGVCLSASGSHRLERSSRVVTEMEQIIRQPAAVTKEKEGYRWSLTVGIPFAIVGLTSATTYRANFYKCGDLTEKTHYLSWHPIGTQNPDFHCPEHFGTIVLE